MQTSSVHFRTETDVDLQQGGGMAGPRDRVGGGTLDLTHAGGRRSVRA